MLVEPPTVNRTDEILLRPIGTGCGLEIRKIGDEYSPSWRSAMTPRLAPFLRGASKDILNEVERNPGCPECGP